jgi:creatinine amidohydrolase
MQDMTDLTSDPPLWSSRFWADLSTREFAQLPDCPRLAEVVAVLPVGAVEQHGPHLPLAVDTVLVDAMVKAALAELAPHVPVLVLPTQSVGYSVEHARFSGTLTLSPETVIRIWTELGACVARTGIRKLVLFNAHGGHVSVMDIVARELRSQHELMVWSSSWFNLPLGPELEALYPPASQRFDVHAGDQETSLMLALQPERVNFHLAQNFASASSERAQTHPVLGNGRSAKLGWQMQDYNPQGAAGNAAAASAAKGHLLLVAVAQQLARLLQEVSALPLSTLVSAAAPARSS